MNRKLWINEKSFVNSVFALQAVQLEIFINEILNIYQKNLFMIFVCFIVGVLVDINMQALFYQIINNNNFSYYLSTFLFVIIK